VDSFALVVFVFWPAVVLVSALLNMLIHWTFSWSELIFDYVIGILLGVFFFEVFRGDANAAEKFFFIFSHGLLAFIHWLAPTVFGSATTFFWWAAIGTVASVVVCGALDWASDSLGPHHGGSVALSFIQFPLKAIFPLITTVVGVLFFLAGLIGAAATRGRAAPVRVGFGGGVLFVEWNPTGGASATTLGAMVNTWSGNLAPIFRHELFHSRQYVYMRDWLIPAWIVGGIWGLVSSAIAGRPAWVCFNTASTTQDLGNPIEVAAYRIGGGNFCN